MSDTQDENIPSGSVTEVEGVEETSANGIRNSSNEELKSFLEDTPKAEGNEATTNTFTEPPLNQTNFKITDNPIKPIPNGILAGNQIYVIGPASHSEAIVETLAHAPKIDPESSKADKRHAMLLTHGTFYTPTDSFLADKLAMPSITWTQHLDSPAGPLRASIPRYPDDRGSKVSGQRAIMRVRSMLGQGTYLNIPCFHSGFWLTLKAPLRPELDELFRTIESCKVDVLNNSYAMALGNSSTFMLRPIMDMIGNHIHDISVKDVGFEWVMDNLSALDVPWILAHLAQMIWRKGFQYAHACINDLQSCANVIAERIEIGKATVVANELFTEAQAAHMTKRDGSSMTKDEVAKYLNDFVWRYGRIAEIKGEDGETIKFFLKDPSVNDYIASGVRWVERLESSVTKTISQNTDIGIRNKHINRAADVTEMMEYAHWVSYIDLGDGQQIEDRETIESVLMDQSGDETLVANFTKAVRSLINDATVAVVAAPTTKCPLCQKEDIEIGGPFKGLVALDALNTFFTLLSQEITGAHKMRIRE